MAFFALWHNCYFIYCTRHYGNKTAYPTFFCQNKKYFLWIIIIIIMDYTFDALKTPFLISTSNQFQFECAFIWLNLFFLKVQVFNPDEVFDQTAGIFLPFQIINSSPSMDIK